MGKLVLKLCFICLTWGLLFNEQKPSNMALGEVWRIHKQQIIDAELKSFCAVITKRKGKNKMATLGDKSVSSSEAVTKHPEIRVAPY